MLSDSVKDWVKDLENEKGYIFLVDVINTLNEMDYIYNTKTSMREETIAYKSLDDVIVSLQKIKENNPETVWIYMLRKSPNKRINIYGKKDNLLNNAYTSINIDIRKIPFISSEGK